MRRMLMAGWLVMIVTPSAWGQGALPPAVAARVDQVPKIRLEFGAGLLEMRRPRVEGDALVGVLRVPKEGPRILGIPITGANGHPIDWRRSVDTLIPISRVLTLEVQNGTHWRRGMLIGGVGGAAFGVLSGLLLANFCLFCTPDQTQEHKDAIIKGMVPVTAFTTAVGLVVGAVAGTGSSRWTMIHRRGEVPLPAIKW